MVLWGERRGGEIEEGYGFEGVGADGRQRMLNAVEAGTVMQIQRHLSLSAF